MKSILKVGIPMVLCICAILSILDYKVKNASQEIRKTKSKYEKYIGTKHVIDGDTLTVIDYSVFNETFTLSDGKEVSSVLIIKK